MESPAREAYRKKCKHYGVEAIAYREKGYRLMDIPTYPC